MAGIELFVDDDYIVDLMQVSISIPLSFKNNTYRENIYIPIRILAKILEAFYFLGLIKLMQIFLIFRFSIFVKPPLGI